MYDEDDEEGLESDEDEEKFGGLDMEEDTDGELSRATWSNLDADGVILLSRANAHLTLILAASDREADACLC